MVDAAEWAAQMADLRGMPVLVQIKDGNVECTEGMEETARLREKNAQLQRLPTMYPYQSPPWVDFSSRSIHVPVVF